MLIREWIVSEPTKIKLHGKDNNCRECHIEPDWLLKYMIDAERLVLVALRTGSHSDLRFG